MLNIDDAAERIRRHFASVSDQQFLDNLRRFCPEIIQSHELETREAATMDTPVLPQANSHPLKLSAYLASALSGLTEAERQIVFLLSDMVNTVCEQNGIELYQPRMSTDPVHHPHVQDVDVFKTDRSHVIGSDLLIFLAHYPSTGSGEELDFAYNAMLPMVVISRSDTRVSRMVTGIPSYKLQLTYTNPEQIREDLHSTLQDIRPFLEERKLAFSRYDANIVGERIRILREQLGLTRDEVANTSRYFTVESLRLLEESTDKVANPSLLQLRQIATVLRTTVADLVEPDVREQAVSILDSWVKSSTAGGISLRDRKRLVRRMLLRVIDLFEDDDQ